MERKWWTLVAVAVGTFMLLLDVTIVNVALPDIQQALDASLSDLQWVIDAYALTLAALQLTAGSLADRFGRRSVRDRDRRLHLGSLLCGLAGGRRSSRSPARSRASAARSCSRRASRCSPGRSTGASAARLRRLRRGHRHRRGRRPGDRRRADQLALVALDLPREHPRRRRRARRHAARGRGVARPAPAPRRLHRPRDLQPRPRRARLRADPLSEDGWGSATVVGSLIAAAVLLVAFVVAEALQKRADVRPHAVPQADVRRRADRRVRDLRVAVLRCSRTW